MLSYRGHVALVILCGMANVMEYGKSSGENQVLKVLICFSSSRSADGKETVFLTVLSLVYCIHLHTS